jgi:two-component system response regulator (stage 0 sporulation protein F)
MVEGKPVILCIDDDQDQLDGLRIVLEANGYVMVEARSAEEGVQVFRERQPDLVIVDLMMEEVDSGTAFVKELKILGADVPIYMISSVGDSMSMTTDYSGLGLAGVFQKPIHTGTLLKVLAKKLPAE